MNDREFFGRKVTDLEASKTRILKEVQAAIDILNQPTWGDADVLCDYAFEARQKLETLLKNEA